MIKEMQDFIEYTGGYADRSEQTIDNYTRWLNEFCIISGIESMKQFNEMALDDLEWYVNTLKRKNQISSIWSKAVAIQSFYTWAVKRGKCPYNLMRDVDLPKRPIKEFTPPNRDQVIEILKCSEKNRTYFTLFSFISQTGTRISEALGAKLSCIVDNSIRIQGKGNKERTVYLQPGMMALLNDYIENHRKEREILSKEDYEKSCANSIFTSYDHYVQKLTEAKDLIFLSNQGGELDRGNVNKALKRYAKEANIDMEKYAIKNHKLRTCFATDAVINHGVKIEEMQQMLGHQDITTTMRYIKMSQEEKKASYNKIPDIGEHFLPQGGIWQK